MGKAALVCVVLVATTACDGEDAKSANAAPSTNAVVTGVASTATSAPPPSPAPVPATTTTPRSTTPNPGPPRRCTAGELAVRLGAPAQVEPGQFDVPLVFTNTGSLPCKLYGVPGVDLRGPADPNGAVYSLPRIDDGDKDVTAAPGQSANAHLIVLTYTDGSQGSNGSGKWVPTQLVTTPPGHRRCPPTPVRVRRIRLVLRPCAATAVVCDETVTVGGLDRNGVIANTDSPSPPERVMGVTLMQGKTAGGEGTSTGWSREGGRQYTRPVPASQTVNANSNRSPSIEECTC
ncbi:DUF4232 domain-containing protein [Amycolatopsis sp. cmx-8-4]|uniref:DUF4232 domain-containing protein n=1 Tax=Amycolatopsis sp. cmx-8-4 TaxID=2790947 RepID=UPI003978C7D5